MIAGNSIAEKFREADAILIGASNGLSITEGLHLFADNAAFDELFGDFKQKYGLRCILQGMMAGWPSEEEKWAFWARLIHHYCGQYQPTPVMNDLKALVGERDYFVVTSRTPRFLRLAQIFTAPRLQNSHSQQYSTGRTETRSPTLNFVTPSPSSVTTPENSCPMTMGGIFRPDAPV